MSFFLLISMSGCASLGELPVMGTISEGVYSQPQGNFACPLTAEAIGLSGAPKITDAYRIVRTEDIPLSRREPGDSRSTRIVSDETGPSRIVEFENASGTYIEIATGKLFHSAEMELASGMSGGNSWLFDRRERAYSSGRMTTGLMLAPWHEEGVGYMGVNFQESYRRGEGPDAQLWIRSKLVIEDVLHSIIIKLPAASLLRNGVGIRDMPAVRHDIATNAELQDELFSQSYAWLDRCQFAEELQ